MRTLSFIEKIIFDSLCSERCIDPSIALESNEVVQALDNGDIEALISVLDNEF
jgi:hypothetical protein